MFDMPSPEIRGEKLKFIEILLIVGGIIGSSRVNTVGMNQILGMFILGSIIYYLMVSNAQNMNERPYTNIAFSIGTCFTAFAFSGLAILPFVFQGMSVLNAIVVFVLWLVLGILILKILAPKPPRATG